MTRFLSRRTMLTQFLRLSVAGGGVVLVAACRRGGAAMCVDERTLSSGQRSLRKSLKYLPQSPAPDKRCAGCVFFSAGTGPSCGDCKILGGPVAADGFCESWAPRPS